MSVTKKELRRLPKKFLSLLLAVTMVLTSVSVCFDTFTFKASAADEDYIAKFCDVMKDEAYQATINAVGSGARGTLKTDGKTNTANIVLETYKEYIQMREILILIDKAMKQTSEWEKTANTVDQQTGGCTNTKALNEALVKELEKKDIAVTTNIKGLLDLVLTSAGATLHDKAVEGTSQATWSNTVTISTTDYKGYLAQVGKASNVAASIELGYQYKITMPGNVYYEVAGSGMSCAKQYYHNMIYIHDIPIDAPAEYTAAANKNAKTTLDAHATYLTQFTSKTYDELLEMVSAGTIDSFLSTYNTNKSDMVSYVGGESTYNALFGDYLAAVSTQLASIQSAKDLQTYLPIVENYKNFVADNPNYGIFSWGENGGANNWGIFGEKGSATHAKMEADYTTFMGYYNSLVAGGTVLDYFVNQGDIDTQYLYNFTDNYRAYYLNDSRNAADACYYANIDGFKDYTIEEQTALLGEVTGFVNAIPSYKSNVRGGELQVINAIYNEGYGYLLDLQEDLKVEINPYVLYFAENAHKTFIDLKTDAVYAKINEAKANETGLTDFYNTLSSSRRDMLLGQLRTDAANMIDGLYRLLADRFTAQVNEATKVYDELKKPTTLDMVSYLKLSAPIMALEDGYDKRYHSENYDDNADNNYVRGADGKKGIHDVLSAAGKGSYVTQAVADWNTFINAIYEEWCRYGTTFGFADYEQSYIADKETDIYPDYRDVYPEDMIRDEAYKVDREKMENLIAALDKIISSDLVGDLLGGLLGSKEGAEFNLGAMLSDLIKGMLFTDDFINTLVKLLYPLVLEKFDEVWATLPDSVPYSGINVSVYYKKTLHDILKQTGFNIYPDLLADVLPAKYADNIAMLKAAGGENDAWESNKLIDYSTGNLMLTWGVDEQKAKLDAGEITVAEFEQFFYNAFADACTGLKPLLTTLITGVNWNPDQVTDIASGSVSIGIGAINLSVNLKLGSTPNNGYANMLVPIYELLGVEYTAVDKITGSEDVAYVLKEILKPVFGFIESLGDAPVDTLLSILPNLMYALTFRMVKPMLNMLQTTITYDASTGLTGSVLADGAAVSLGDILINNDAGALLKEDIFSNGLTSILANFGLEIPAIDQSLLGTLGELDTIETGRGAYIYSGLEGTGTAYSIVADKADVGYYLLSYILGLVKDEAALTGLLGKFMTVKDENGEAVLDDAGNAIPDEEAMAGIKKVIYETLNLDEMDVGDVIAAIVELANQVDYNIDGYVWYDGTKGTPIGMTPATEIYLNPENDWTEEKAEYLYTNIETLLTSIFTMAGLDINIEDSIATALGELFTNANLTTLAKMLGGLDLNELLSGLTAGDEADAPETVAEGEEGGEGEAEAAPAIDLMKILKDELGIDFAEFAKYADLADDYSWGFEDGDAAAFGAKLVEILAPLKPVIDFIFVGKDLTLINSAITLNGYKGYDNAIVPLLEALGCENVTALAEGEDALAKLVNALVAKINSLTVNDPEVANDGLIYTIIDMVPGLLYYLSSNGLGQGVAKLLAPAYAVLDTIRPIYNVDLGELLGGIEVDFDKDGTKEPLGLDINNLDLAFVLDLVNRLVGLDLSGLALVVYDVCKVIGVEYDSASTLDSTWKKGAYNANFDQADLLTVLLSFILEWATVPANAAKLDELLKTNGIISSLNKVFEDVEIKYGTPDWMYWFDTEDEFNAYVEGDAELPNTLAMLTYPNDWNDETAQYIADEIANLVDLVIGLINADKEDAAKNVKDLLGGLLNGYLTADSLNQLVGLITGLLENVDEKLLETIGVLLDVDILGLKSYVAPEIVATEDVSLTEAFAAELANVLTTYAGSLMNWLFFGDDFRFAKKLDNTDSIVINGGFGYEKGLALVLEALGCDVPAADKATVENVLAALASRVDEILAAPVNEVIDLLPNLVYFLNANGASVAVDNLLQPVYALLEKIKTFGVELDLAELLGFDIKYLSLDDILALVESMVGLDLSAARAILVDFCVGKIEKTDFTYKMTAERKDVITILLTTALLLIESETNVAKLEELIDTDIISAIDEVFKSTPVVYASPDWDYCFSEDGIDYDNHTVEIIESAITYPNDWTEEKSKYLAENLPRLVDTVVEMVSDYDSLSDLLKSNVNVFTTETLNSLVTLIANLLSNVDDELLKAGVILNVDLVGLKAYTAPEGIATVDAFAAELANILSTYAEGVVDWLLLGDDFKFFVEDADADGEYDEGEDIITINGAHGYAEGLALILEALGCENLPAVYGVEDLKTEEVVLQVLTSVAARINEIFDAPVEEVLDILPNLLYFINANGVAAAVNNIAGAFNALALKLKTFGLDIELGSLLNLQKLMKIEGKGATISLENLAMSDLLQAVSLMTGLDLTKLSDVLVGFALGEVNGYASVSRTSVTAKMEYKDEFDKHDMITVLVTSVLLALVETEGNAEKLGEMIGTDILGALETVFASVDIEYTAPDWNYPLAENGTVDTMKYAIAYPNDWTEDKAEYLATNLPKLVDTVVGMVSDYDSLKDILKANVNVFTADTLNSLVSLIADLLGGIDEGLLEAAGILLDANVVGLKSYTAPADIDTTEEFAAELANVLNTYAKGVVEWLLLGDDYKFFVKDVDAEGIPVDFITINGAQGYAEGLALLLEALGCKNLPDAYAADITTEEIVSGTLASLAARIDEILEAPVENVLGLLPNLLYFLNANGVAAVINNLTAAITALLDKLAVFGVEIDINELVNLQKLMGIEGKGAKIDLDNLSMADLLEAVSLMTGLDLTKLSDVLVGFALGKVEAYQSVSKECGVPKMMSYADEFDKHDMITVLVTAALLVVFETEGNEEKLAEMLGTDLIAAIEDVFASVEIEYTAPDWNYPLADNGTVDAMKYLITYPNNWTEETAKYVTEVLPEIGDMVANMIDGNYATLADLLKANVNIFTADTLNSLVGLIAGLLGDIDEALIEAAGMLLDVDLVGLKSYTAPASVDTTEEFAAELANVLNTYAKGVVEWLLLGRDYKFLVKNAGNEEMPADFIVINGAQGYAEGLALLLEALGCTDLPDAYAEGITTEEIVSATLASLAKRIDAIFANPVVEVLALLPNLIYFLNTNGVAAVIDNTIAAITALLDKLTAFGIELDINELVNLQKLMGIEGKGAKIDLDNLSMADLLEAVSLMVGLDLTLVEDVLVGFALGKVEKYTSVSKECGEPKRMLYADEFDTYDMVTVLANLVLITLTDKENAEFVKGLIGEEAYLLVLSLFSIGEVPVQEFNWLFTDRADTDYVFSAMESSDLYKNHKYGTLYTEEKAQYIADNIGEFIDNIIYLLGLEVNGETVDTLTDFLNGLVNGSLYNSENVVAIRDALAGVLEGIKGLEVSGINAGKHIAAVLKAAEIADIEAVANVEIPEFTEDRAQFTAALCDVLEPLYGVLEWVLADDDISFFVNADKTDAITLPGGEGYAYGVIPLLELLECDNILTPAEYYAAVEADSDVVLTSILNPALDRVDEILLNPAEEILEMIPNIVYFINSNGADTVVKNTLNAVYSLLAAIEPIAKIDLYELIGLDLSTLTFDKIFEMVLDLIAESTGYEFSVMDASPVIELTIGSLVSYTSKNGKKAYKMIQQDAAATRETVTVVMRLAITFLMHENNREVLVNILKDTMGMSEDGAKYLDSVLKLLGDCTIGTSSGMDKALATIYYIYYGADTAIDKTTSAIKNVNAAWVALIEDMTNSNDRDRALAGKIISDVLGLEIFDDVLTPDEGIAPNGFLAFFQKIAEFFRKIGEWLRNIFS